MSARPALALSVLAVSVSGALALPGAPQALGDLTTRSVGTAQLGTATCTDWRHDGEAGRRRTIAALGIAATQPNPESRGATLESGAAYLLFERACSTPASSTALLYEVYNRAAAFQPAATAIIRQGGFGTAPHR